jgi:hypothetical protein
MTCSTPLFAAKQRLLKSVFILSKTDATWRFREDPAIGVRSLRSGRIFRHADGSVTTFESRLQAWVIRPVRAQAYWRRVRTLAQADQAPSSSLDESNDTTTSLMRLGSDKLS